MTNITKDTKVEQVNYDTLLQNYSWILEKNHNCIISPDTDGLLCALLMSHTLNWSVKGFYDGKILAVENGVDIKDTVFLDMEIFRKSFKSIGQHLLMPNKDQIVHNWDNFSSCISPNNLRNFDAKNNFSEKFPFATIHFLLSILGNEIDLKPNKTMAAPLLFVDGTFKSILNYPENCLSWLGYIDANNNLIMNELFHSTKNSLEGVMKLMQNFFAGIREECGTTRGSEKIKLDKNLEYSSSNSNLYNLNEVEIAKNIRFLKFLERQTGWHFKQDNWTWTGMVCHNFTKGTLEPSTSYQRRNKIIAEKIPLSYAITATNRMEYTLISEEQELLFGD